MEQPKLKIYKPICFMILICGLSCTWEQMKPQVDCSLSPVNVELIESNDTSCGSADGSFTINASGGEPPYTYSTNATSNADGIFEDIVAGNYTVIAIDSKGCTGEVNVGIKNLNGVNLEEVLAVASDCGSTNGSIQVNVGGGHEPYLFSLNGGTAQQNNVFSNLQHGSYTVNVIDQLGCEVTESVALFSGVSYENSIKAIIANNCAISGCHSGSVSPNLSTFSSIQSSASRIKARTANGSMPKGSTLSQDQIDMIACWVDDGARQN